MGTVQSTPDAAVLSGGHRKILEGDKETRIVEGLTSALKLS